MGLFGDLWDVAKHAGAGVAHAVEKSAEELGNITTGTIIGTALGGPIGGVIGGWIGSQAGKGTYTPLAGGLTPEELVKRVTEGPGTGSLENAHQAGIDQATYQAQLEQGTRELTSGLEAAWTGGGADAARARLQPLTDSAVSASASLQQNSNLSQAQVDQFHAMKNALHTDVTGPPPSRSAWDVATPWDTDTEDKINQYQQKAAENVEKYNGYNQQSTSNTAARTIDYGQLGKYGGGDFTVEKPGGGKKPVEKKKKPVEKPGKPLVIEHPPGIVEPPGRPIGIAEPPGPPAPYDPKHPPVGPPDQVRPPGSDDTHIQGYVKPSTSGFPGQTFGPGGDSSGFGPGGGSSAGFGPGSGGFSGGFGPGGGSGAGMPGGEPGARSGAGMTGGGRPGAGGAMGSGATGKPGSPGMGGMGRGAGKGEGSEDEEHQRASYLLEPDAESIFGGSDEKPVPPVIGL